LGQGGFIFCEWDSVQKEYPDFQRAFADLEVEAINSCTDKWFPKLTPEQAFGYLTPGTDQFGRTSILPALFDPNPNTYNGQPFGGAAFSAAWPAPPRYWRQAFTQDDHQTLIQGQAGGETIPESFQVSWMGLAFPNKNQHITEIRWQTSDHKLVRVNIEEMLSYNKPAIIFEEGFLLKEEQAFHLYGYFEGSIPVSPFSPTLAIPPAAGEAAVDTYVAYQRIVMLGAAYYKVIDKVLGNAGDAI